MHSDRLGVLLEALPRLALGADEHDVLSAGGRAGHELLRQEKTSQRLLHVDDVNEIAFAEDVRTHLRIPSTGAVTKVNARVDQFFHQFCRQVCTSTLRPGFLHPSPRVLLDPNSKPNHEPTALCAARTRSPPPPGKRKYPTVAQKGSQDLRERFSQSTRLPCCPFRAARGYFDDAAAAPALGGAGAKAFRHASIRFKRSPLGALRL